MKTLLIVSWFILGAHSVYYFIKSYRKHYDITTDEIPLIVVCFIFPIAAHIGTYVAYGFGGGDSKILFKKKTR